MSRFFFRSNASSREKAFTVVAFGTCLLSIYGFATEFSPSTPVKQAAWCLAALFAALFTIAILRDRHPSNRVHTFGPVKKLCYATLLFGTAWGLSFGAIGLGAASVANSALGSVSTSRAKITTIASPNYGKGCKFSFSIRYASSNEVGSRICTSEDYWLTLRVGQDISIVQKRSTLGTSVVGLQSDG
jgi:hypothetical protein